MIKKITTLVGEIAARHSLDVLPNIYKDLNKKFSENIINKTFEQKAISEITTANKKLGFLSGLTAINQLLFYIFLIIFGIITIAGVVVYFNSGSFGVIKPFIFSISILFFILFCQIVVSCVCLVKATFLYWKRPDF